MRQPQASKLSVLMDMRQASTTSSDRNRPMVAVVWIQLVYSPRFPSGACSAT